jgi:KilA-N domain
MKQPPRQKGLRYNRLVTSKKGVIRCGSLFVHCDEGRRHASSAAFCCARFMAARMGSRKAHGFTSVNARLPHLFDAAAICGSLAAVDFKVQLEPIMANTLSIGTFTIREVNGFYSLNDLHKAAGRDGKHQPSNFLRIDATRALVAEIANSSEMRNPVFSKQGVGTYACKELAIAYASWINAAFHLKVIRVFLDVVQPQHTTPQQQALPLAPAAAYNSTPSPVELALQAEAQELIQQALRLNALASKMAYARGSVGSAICINPPLVNNTPRMMERIN